MPPTDPPPASPLGWIALVPKVTVIVLMIVAMTDMLVGVFLRYVWTWLSAAFDLPQIRFFWVEEVGEYSLIWMTFIGAALGIRRGTHFSIQMITERLSARGRRWVFTIHYVLIAGFGAVVAIFGWSVSELNSQSVSPALSLNLRWLYLSAVAGGALIVVYALATARDAWQGRLRSHDVPEEV